MSDPFHALRASEVPDHTCLIAAGGGDSAERCPRCAWVCERFAYIYPIYLASAPGAVEDGPESADGERFGTMVNALGEAGATITAWWHSAVMCVQLAAAPVTIDRGKWDWLLQEDPLQQLTCDAIDKVFAAATDRTGGGRKIFELVKDFSASQIIITHLVTSYMAFDLLGQNTDSHQRVAQQMLLQDAPFAVTRPHEFLLAARIAGAVAARDTQQWQRLSARVFQLGIAGQVCSFWAYGCARLMDPGEPLHVMLADDNGIPEFYLTPDADMAELGPHPVKRGVVLAMKLVRSIADGDRGAAEEFHQLLTEEAHARETFQALAAWYGHNVRYVHNEAVAAA